MDQKILQKLRPKKAKKLKQNGIQKVSQAKIKSIPSISDSVDLLSKNDSSIEGLLLDIIDQVVLKVQRIHASYKGFERQLYTMLEGEEKIVRNKCDLMNPPPFQKDLQPELLGLNRKIRRRERENLSTSILIVKQKARKSQQLIINKLKMEHQQKKKQQGKLQKLHQSKSQYKLNSLKRKFQGKFDPKESKIYQLFQEEQKSYGFKGYPKQTKENQKSQKFSKSKNSFREYTTATVLKEAIKCNTFKGINQKNYAVKNSISLHASPLHEQVEMIEPYEDMLNESTKLVEGVRVKRSLLKLRRRVNLDVYNDFCVD